MSAQLFPSAESHIIDSNLFIRFERHDTVDLLERAVTEHGVTLLVPTRVYEELTPGSYPHETPPIEDALEAGWVQLLDAVDYSNPVVSATMDMVRQYISVATGRPEHMIEQGQTESIAIYTNDLSAFRGIERALTQHDYKDSVQLVKAFDFATSVENRYQFSP